MLSSSQQKWLHVICKSPHEVRGRGVRPVEKLAELGLVKIESVGTPWTKGWWRRATATDKGRAVIAVSLEETG